MDADKRVIEFGGVKFDNGKIEELVNIHAKQNIEAAMLLRIQQTELHRMRGLLDEAVELIKVERLLERDRIFEGAGCPGFDGPMQIETKFDSFLEKVRGGK